MKALVGAFNQEKALVGAFSVITNLRMELFQALLLILIENTETSPESARANIALSRLEPRKQTAWKTCSSVLRDIYTPALSTPTLVSHYAVNELQQSDGTLMDICIPEEGY